MVLPSFEPVLELVVLEALLGKSGAQLLSSSKEGVQFQGFQSRGVGVISTPKDNVTG